MPGEEDEERGEEVASFLPSGGTHARKRLQGAGDDSAARPPAVLLKLARVIRSLADVTTPGFGRLDAAAAAPARLLA